MGILRPEERGIIEHSLGLSRSSESYRNYFCAGDDHSDTPQIKSLIALGFMRESHKINGGSSTIYVVTEAGKAALNKTI
jgi:hypothetical protein